MRKAFLILLLVNILRLILIPFIVHLPTDTNYLDTFQAASNTGSLLPTLTVWINILTTHLLGSGLIVRKILFFIITLLTQWCLYLLIIKIIRPERKYISWAVISSVLSLTILSVSAIPDTLLMLFWVLSVLTLYNAIFNVDKKSWLLSGIFMGMAMLNKLSGIALPVGLVVFLIFSSRYRYFLFKPGPYIALILSFLLSLPIWNGMMKLSNPLPTSEQINGITQILHLSSINYIGFIGFQIVLIYPVLYIGLWWVTLKYFGRFFKKPNQVNPEFWFLLSFFLPAFLGFHMISFFTWVDYLGLIPVYTTGMIVLLKLIKNRWFYWSLGFSIVVHVILLAGLI